MFKYFTLLFLAVLISLMSLKSSFAQEGIKVNFSVCAEYLIQVPVKVNNKPALYLLDTGANRTVVSDDIPGLKTEKLEEEVITLSGRTKVETGVLNRFVIGNQAILQKEVIRLDLRSIKKVCPEVEGIIGNDILSKFNYLIDYEKKQIEISKNRIVMGVPTNYLTFEEQEGRIVIPIKYQNQMKRLILDTAASTTTFFESDFRVKVNKNAVMVTEGGRLGASFFKADLIIGTVKFGNCELGKISWNDPERTENGLLAARIFRRLYIDNTTQQIAFD